MVLINSFEEVLKNWQADKPDFTERLKQINNQIKVGMKKRDAFVKRFSKEYILNSMTLDEFAVGKGIKDTFCNTLENGLLELGYMGSSTSKKFGIYYDQNSHLPVIGKSYWSENCKDYNESFNKIKGAICDLLDAAADMNLELIESNELSSSFKSKIIATYYPDIYLSIFSDDHVKKFLNYFGVHYDPREFNTLEKRKILLNDYREHNEFFKDKSMLFFMVFMYSDVFKRIVLGKEIDEEIDQRKIEVVDWNYIESLANVKKEHRSRTGVSADDYIKAAKSKMETGENGEEAIVRFEKNRLKNLGFNELAEKVHKVSGPEGDDSLGYDVISYEVIDGNEVEIHIEVKTTKNKKEQLDFFITSNEYEHFKNDKNHRIYYLFNINGNPKLHIVDNSAFKDDYLEPVLYKVKVKVERK